MKMTYQTVAACPAATLVRILDATPSADLSSWANAPAIGSSVVMSNTGCFSLEPASATCGTAMSRAATVPATNQLLTRVFIVPPRARRPGTLNIAVLWPLATTSPLLAEPRAEPTLTGVCRM